MKRISIQFHATPEEIATFVARILDEFSGEAALLVLKPFTCSRLSSRCAEAQIIEAIGDRRLSVVFTVGRIDCSAGSPNSFLDNNPGAVVLDIGRLSDRGLEESCLSIKSDDVDGIKLGQRMSKALRHMTRAGAIAVNPETGAIAKLRSHRYSEDAAMLAKRGVKMLPVAGNSIIEFNF